MRRGLNFSRTTSRPLRDAGIPSPSPVSAPLATRTNGTFATAAMDGGSGGDAGAAPGFGLSHARRFSRSSRQQSVEDELWGWFGDDRPPSDFGDVRSFGVLGGGVSSDRLFSRVDSGFRGGGGGGGRRAAEAGAGLGSTGDGAEMSVSVSMTALEERLAKLSAGRALLDQLRAESRALAKLVSSAARRAFTGGDADACEGRDGVLLPVAGASQEDSATPAAAGAAAAATTADTPNIVRRVSISAAPVTIVPAATVTQEPSSSAAAGQPPVVACGGITSEEGEQATAVDERGPEPSGSLPLNSCENNGHDGRGSGGDSVETVAEELQTEARNAEGQEMRADVAVEQEYPPVEGISQGPADGSSQGTSPSSGGENAPVVRREEMDQESSTKAPGDQDGGSGSVSSTQQQQQQQEEQCGMRQGVIEARAELQRLQREIRLLAREGESARGRVSPLVARRAVLARAMLPGARTMARRLQEVADNRRVR